jgi:tetratricopeptide (TPR) repeat protein
MSDKSKFEPQLRELYNNCRKLLRRDGSVLNQIRREDILISPDVKGPMQPDLHALIAFLRDNRFEQSPRSAPLFFKSYCLLHELYDYWHAEPCLNRALPLKAEIVSLRGEMGKFRESASVMKERVRLISIYANEIYRRGFYQEALTLLERGEDELQRQGISSLSVLGGLKYVKGKIKQQQGYYRESELLFVQASCHYAESAEQAGRSEEGRALAAHKSALALGGLARSKARRGRSDEACAIVQAARGQLRATSWHLNKAHLDLIYADILRTIAGTDRSKLEKPMVIARKALEVFTKAHHKRLELRARFLIGLLYYYSGELNEALSEAKLVTDYATRTKSERWRLNGLLLQARTQLSTDTSSANAALDAAETIIMGGAESIAPDQQAECRIIKGEILKRLANNKQDAEHSFLQAIEVLSKSSPDGSFREVNQKTLGWVYLNLMEVSLDLGKHVKAEIYLKKWKELDDVEPRWLHERAVDLEGRLDEFRDGVFVYSPDKRLRSLRSQETDMREKYRVWRARQTALVLHTDVPEEICRELGTSVSSVSRAFRKEGSPLRKRGRKSKREL